MLKEFAKDLRIQREKKDISLEDIAAQTRLNITIFEKFENGDFSFEPEIYIRAFLKQYAKSIDLDEEQTLKDYDLAKTGKYTPSAAGEKSEETVKKEPVKEEPSVKTEPKKDALEKKETDGEKKDIESIKSEKKESDNTGLKETPVVKSREEDLPKNKEEYTRPGFKKIKDDRGNSGAEKKSGTGMQESEKPRLHSSDGFKSEKTGSLKKEPGYSNGSGGGFDSTVLKKVGVVFVFLLILAGLYYLIDAIFLSGPGKDEPEIVRQNFDDVVAENEKKILGKRTEQEIQDSIKAAEEEQRRLLEQNLDTMTLVITSTGRGSVIIIEDSTNFDNPERITFGRNEVGTWKATKYFHISSPNTNSFTAVLNGKKINFGKRKIDNYLITRESVAGEKGDEEKNTNTGNVNQNNTGINTQKTTNTEKPKTEKPKNEQPSVKPKKTEAEEEKPPASEEEKGTSPGDQPGDPDTGDGN